ncbi:MAG: hypothetical protein ACK4SZ_02890 [Allosphingosinicella sp.]|uniref:hypothetical protein n=1 Tax=Allosphingosinicella sp. TaxID=2823234 RepID=UPI003929EC33
MRRLKVVQRCSTARRSVADEIERRRLASPAIQAESMITDSLSRLKQHKAAAERQLDEKRERSLLKWWLDLTRPTFEEVDAKIEKLEFALRRLIASDCIAKTNEHFATLLSRVQTRTGEIERLSLSAIPISRHVSFDDDRVVHNALLLSALSIPVSAWRDISLATSVYDTLREVNGNYALMSDVDIWLATLTMPGPELAGLASLTKGAFFEKLVEGDFGGERFEHFNHPDTDILIDGVAYQIKATDSISYIDSVDDNIPVISTSEVAGITASLDGGYTNEDLTNIVDSALGGTVIDVGDTALDAVLAGVGGVGIFALLRGVQHASARYKESGDALASLVEGANATAISTTRSAVNLAELATKGTLSIVTSKPMRFTGRMLLSGVKRVDQWLVQEEKHSSGPHQPPRGSSDTPT